MTIKKLGLLWWAYVNDKQESFVNMNDAIAWAYNEENIGSNK